jgi:hypothetical protein
MLVKTVRSNTGYDGADMTSNFLLFLLCQRNDQHISRRKSPKRNKRSRKKKAKDADKAKKKRRQEEVVTKEVNKEQPSYRNLSATATRVPQCTCPVAASRKDFSAIHTSAQTIHS